MYKLCMQFYSFQQFKILQKMVNYTLECEREHKKAAKESVCFFRRKITSIHITVLLLRRCRKLP